MYDELVDKLLENQSNAVKFDNIEERDDFALRLVYEYGIGRGYLSHNRTYDQPYLYISTGREVHLFQWLDGHEVILELPKPISPLDMAIEEYRKKHGIVGTRPFRILLRKEKHFPKGLPSLWYRFKDGVLEYEYTNGWNKAHASELVLILSEDEPFLEVKGGRK